MRDKMMVIGETAVLTLQEGIDNKDRTMILEAYDMVEADSFNWDECLPYVFEEWDKLVDEANDILY